MGERKRKCDKHVKHRRLMVCESGSNEQQHFSIKIPGFEWNEKDFKW